jgi:hypothetical protein
MKTITILCLSILLGNANLFYAQVSQEWATRYHGTKLGAEARALKTDNFGNVYVTGYCTNVNTNIDIVTIKYGSNGQILWISTYSNGNEYEGGREIAIDKNSNVYVIGDANSGNSSVILKYNSSGVQQWVKKHNQSYPTAICIDSAGNIYVAEIAFNGGFKWDIKTIKFNSSGEENWIKTFNNNLDSIDYPCSIGYYEGYIYVAGLSVREQTGECNILIKYDTSGNNKWIAYAPFREPHKMSIDNFGSVYITGGSGYGNFATVKFDSLGQINWSAEYHRTSGYCEANSITVDKIGNVYVTGVAPGGPGNDDIGTVKYNSSGIQQWVVIYNGPGNSNDAGNDILVDSIGNIYVTGFSTGTSNNYDFSTIKYSQYGQQLWSILYNGTGNFWDESFAISLDNSGNIYICGRSPGLDTIYEFTTVKYSQLINVQNLSNSVPVTFSLHQNYPNPFNPSTKIHFEIPLSRGVSEGRGVSVKLIIYDALGREIAVLVNEQLKPGTYEVEWNAVNYPSGVYFYKLSSGDFSHTRKMVLIK